MKTHKADNRATYLEYLRLDGEAWTGNQSMQFFLPALIADLYTWKRWLVADRLPIRVPTSSI